MNFNATRLSVRQQQHFKANNSNIPAEVEDVFI